MKIYDHIIKIIIACCIAVAISAWAFPYVFDSFRANIEIAVLILVTFVAGLLFDLDRIIKVETCKMWIISCKRNKNLPPKDYIPAIMEDIQKKKDSNGRLTEEEYYTSVKILDLAITNSKDAGRFFVNLCLGIGLLGTLLGIIKAVKSIADIFQNLDLNINAATESLGTLQRQLSEPLQILSGSFSLTFLGISFYILLSYIDRQAFISEKKFLIFAQNWLLLCTKLRKND